MELRDLGPDGQSALERVLGYLNFSAGAEDPQFLIQVNKLYAILEGETPGNAGADTATCYHLLRLLNDKLDEVAGRSGAFQDAGQARRMVELLRESLLPGYRRFHQDLLFHQTDQTLFRPLLLGRICEALLRQGEFWSDAEECTRRAIHLLNDYVGYRPVAVLENRPLEPHAHERVRPIPIYISGVGVGHGRYMHVVRQALQMLEQTNPSILRAACFQPQQLIELAIDPRAYDFDHPVNKRPNYHFGQWDPHSIDNRGMYYRFVIQQVTIDSLMSRIGTMTDAPAHQIETEAAAVLAGTILMAAGISGTGPDTYDSQTTLGNLLPSIAGYRDHFYEQLIQQLASWDATHAQRLRDESRRFRQPFGSARQHLNSQLTRHRASQLEHVRLASVYARMGYPEAAQKLINAVPVASARMICQIDCNLTLTQRLVHQDELGAACQKLRATRDILLRGIECGAIVDPWNIIGFDGNFSLFPAMENSVHDHRVDELLGIVEEIFDSYGRLWSLASALSDKTISQSISLEMEDFAKWWHQFAAHEVSNIDCPDPLDLFRAAKNVADALEHWRESGEETGAIRFWAPYVETFDSPKAYAMVISMLLDRRDAVASRGLLIHWLGQAERVPLEQGEESFYRLAARWLVQTLQLEIDEAEGANASAVPCRATPDDWQRAQKFFDYLEANAGVYWQVPHFASTETDSASDEPAKTDTKTPDENPEADAEEEELFGAAYEDVVYRDSTDDGVDSSVFETGGQNEALDATHDAIVDRLAFLNSLCRLRRIAAVAWIFDSPDRAQRPPMRDTLLNWLDHTQAVHAQLRSLALDVWRHRLSRPTHDYLSLAEFDRERTIKESLMEHVITSCVEAAQCGHFIVCALRAESRDDANDIEAIQESFESQMPRDERLAVRLIGAALHGNGDEVRATWRELKIALRSQAVLYVPLVRGGNPESIISVRSRQQVLRTLLSWLPRLGLLTETRELIDVIRQMERNVPAGPGAVTEFDDLFDLGFRALVDCVIRATNVDEAQDLGPSGENGSQLVSCLESMTESMLVTWLAHSRTLRLSVLEKVKSSGAWQELVDFIKDYGSDLFTQQFLSLANVRSILYQGVDAWLTQIEEDPPPGFHPKLVESLDKQISREDAIRYLTLTLEAIVENYAEYRDYNSTTTQSDRGDLLYNLLDFLRLLSNYERIVWNLKPVIVAHELLVRRGCNQAAQMWRRALSERIGDEADRYQERLIKLQQRYAMQLPTIADRIGERFLRPLIVDRMRALVIPAIMHPDSSAFEILENEARLLTDEPSGVGFDPPGWLIALEEEVRRWRRQMTSVDEQQLLQVILPTVPLTIEDLQRQIRDWEKMSNG